MICCSPTISSFLNEAVTTIPYIGSKPIVSVVYLQADGTFISSGINTHITFTLTDIIIDHGGTFSGQIKLMQ